MHKLVLLQKVTKLLSAMNMLFVAAFTELLQFPLTSRVGWKLEYPAWGIFQYLNICFKPKFPLPLDSPLLIQWLKFSFLTISFWYFAAFSWIAFVPSRRRWPLSVFVTAQNFLAGPQCSTVITFLWCTEKIQPGRSVYQEKWKHGAPRLHWKMWTTSKWFVCKTDPG